MVPDTHTPTPKRLTAADIDAAAQAHGLDPAALSAVVAVESGGSGFLPDGRPKLLLEGHILWRRLLSRGIDPHALHAARPDLCFPTWTRAHYRGGAGEWERLGGVTAWAGRQFPQGDQRRMSYYKAALEACSWGLFQILGQGYATAGFADVLEMVAAMKAGELQQLQAILRWMAGNGLLEKLRAKNWLAFTAGYNGPGQVPIYSARLAAAYWKAKRA